MDKHCKTFITAKGEIVKLISILDKNRAICLSLDSGDMVFIEFKDLGVPDNKLKELIQQTLGEN